MLYFLFYLFFKYFIYLLLETGEGREKERERNISVWLPLAHPLLGTWPATKACAMTGNRTSYLSVCRPGLNPLSHTSQGLHFLFSCFILPSMEIGIIWVALQSPDHLLVLVRHSTKICAMLNKQAHKITKVKHVVWRGQGCTNRR